MINWAVLAERHRNVTCNICLDTPLHPKFIYLNRAIVFLTSSTFKIAKNLIHAMWFDNTPSTICGLKL